MGREARGQVDGWNIPPHGRETERTFVAQWAAGDRSNRRRAEAVGRLEGWTDAGGAEKGT